MRVVDESNKQCSRKIKDTTNPLLTIIESRKRPCKVSMVQREAVPIPGANRKMRPAITYHKFKKIGHCANNYLGQETLLCQLFLRSQNQYRVNFNQASLSHRLKQANNKIKDLKTLCFSIVHPMCIYLPIEKWLETFTNTNFLCNLAQTMCQMQL